MKRVAESEMALMLTSRSRALKIAGNKPASSEKIAVNKSKSGFLTKKRALANAPKTMGAVMNSTR
ncbi:hypothetical protein FQZ97_1184910 [compost metagenome]